MTLALSTYTGSLTQVSLSKTVSRQAQLVAWRHLGRCSLPDGLVDTGLKLSIDQLLHRPLPDAKSSRPLQSQRQ
jgi:hypothetical protein